MNLGRDIFYTFETASSEVVEIVEVVDILQLYNFTIGIHLRHSAERHYPLIL